MANFLVVFKAREYLISLSEISALLLCLEGLAVSSFVEVEVSSSVSSTGEKMCICSLSRG